MGEWKVDEVDGLETESCEVMKRCRDIDSGSNSKTQWMGIGKVETPLKIHGCLERTKRSLTPIEVSGGAATDMTRQTAREMI